MVDDRNGASKKATRTDLSCREVRNTAVFRRLPLPLGGVRKEERPPRAATRPWPRGAAVWPVGSARGSQGPEGEEGDVPFDGVEAAVGLRWRERGPQERRRVGPHRVPGPGGDAPR